MVAPAAFKFGYEIGAFGVPINPYTNGIDLARTPIAGVLRGIDQRGAQGQRIFDEILRDTLIPPIVEIWPRRTGYSGDGFDFNAGVLDNRAPYARSVEARGGYASLAIEQNLGRAAGALDDEVQRIIDRGGSTSVAHIARRA